MGAVSLVDPTKPPQLSPTNEITEQKSLNLTAVFIYPAYRLAIINGKAVMVGDKIEEFTVTTITPYTVELSGMNDHKEILQLTLPIRQNR